VCIRMPKAVFIGLAGHFIFMPLIGFTIAHTFGFAPEIAAGIILVGSVPCGWPPCHVLSLRMRNVALSVTLTAVGTLLAPVTTPLLMHLLAANIFQRFSCHDVGHYTNRDPADCSQPFVQSIFGRQIPNGWITPCLSCPWSPLLRSSPSLLQQDGKVFSS